MAPPPKKRPSTEQLLSRWEADKKSRIFLQLAEEYRKQDFVDAAVSVLKDGLKHHPSFAPAHVALARCYMARRQWTEAQGELERVHSKSPDNLLAGKLLVEVLEERGEKARALAVAKELVPFAGFDDPDVELTAKRLEKELAGPAVRPSAEASDTMDFGSGDTSDLRAGSADDTAGVAAAMVEDPTEEPILMDVDAFGEEAEARPVRQAATSFAGPSLQDRTGSEEADRRPSPETSPFGESVTAESPATPTSPETSPFGEPATEESASEQTSPETSPFGAVETGPPDDLLGQGPPAAGREEETEDELTSVTLAELYEAQDSHEEAAAIYRKLLERRPEDPNLRSALERCRARLAVESSGEVQATTSGEVPVWEPEPTRPEAPRMEEAPAPFEDDEPSPEHLRALLAEYERLLAAVQAVRQ